MLPSTCFDDQDELQLDADVAGPIFGALAMPAPARLAAQHRKAPKQPQWRSLYTRHCMVVVWGDAPPLTWAVCSGLFDSWSAHRSHPAQQVQAAPVPAPAPLPRVTLEVVVGGDGAAGGDDGVQQQQQQQQLEASELPHAAAVHCAVTRLQKPAPKQSSMQKRRAAAGIHAVRLPSRLGQVTVV
jgi:hypothetical protein